MTEPTSNNGTPSADSADSGATRDKSAYFAQYYEDNRPAILAKRRLRYRNDPEYRHRMQQKARDRAREKAVEQRKTNLDDSRTHADDLRKKSLNLADFGPQKVKHWPVGDFVTASVVAQALNVSLGTLGNWIRGGTLPSPTVSSTAGKHLFSLSYLELVRECRIHALANGMSNDGFSEFVKSKYQEIVASEELLRNGGIE